MELAKIVIDETIYPRRGVDMFHVQRLIEAIDAGAKLPPLVVESVTHRLVDGRHRLEALNSKGIKTSKVVEKSYATEAEIFSDAARLNIEHGRMLTHYDIKNIVARLSTYGYGLNKISEVVRVPTAKLEEIQRGFATAPGGEPTALKGGLSHMRGESLTAKQMEVNRRYAGGKATFYLRQIIDLLENDLWPEDSDKFASDMDKLVSLWDARRERAAAA